MDMIGIRHRFPANDRGAVRCVLDHPVVPLSRGALWDALGHHADTPQHFCLL